MSGKFSRQARNCLACSAVFYPPQENVRKGFGLYCSKPCIYAHRRQETPTRFAAYVGEPTVSGCTLWQAGLSDKGYGKFWMDRKTIGAHVAAWILARGAVPAGLFVCHSCDTPACVNVAHLFLGTAADNKADSVSKSRHAHGERQGTAKLTSEQVITILKVYATGTSSTRKLAREYGVSRSQIQFIIHRKSWRHVSA